MTNKQSAFKIAMVAPSRIGKTSLITAILQDGKDLLAGTPVSLTPKDAKTTARIAQHANELRGSMRAREFNAGALSGTQEPFEFNLVLQNKESPQQGLDLQFLDFPGGWLQDLIHGEGTAEQRECADFVRSCTALLLVVDASLVMEASRSAEKRSIDSILKISETEGIVEEWAKARSAAPDEPALLLICPVKCESYFDDNGGFQDLSDELYQKTVWEIYEQLFGIVETDAPAHTEVLYAPVDTIGCVEFSHADWDDLDTPNPVFNPSFRIRGNNPKQKVAGASDILLAIAKQIFRYKESMAQQAAQVSLNQAKQEKARAADKNIFETVYSLFGGVTEKDKKAAAAHIVANQQMSQARSATEVLNALASQDFGPRIRKVRMKD